MRHYCLNGLKKLMQLRHAKEQKAQEHYKSVINRKIFDAWHFDIRVELNNKKSKADYFYRKFLLRNCFTNLKSHKNCLQIENAKARRFFNYHLKQKLFEAWRSYKYAEKEKMIGYDKLIEDFQRDQLRRKYFKMIKEYPSEMKKFRVRQKRLDELRSKVKLLIPDYETPPSTGH